MPPDDFPGWEELLPSREPPAKGPSEEAAWYAATFTPPVGQRVLEHLRKAAQLDMALHPSKHTTEELQFVEGKRSVVLHILGMIERGKRGE